MNKNSIITGWILTVIVAASFYLYRDADSGVLVNKEDVGLPKINEPKKLIQVERLKVSSVDPVDNIVAFKTQRVAEESRRQILPPEPENVAEELYDEPQDFWLSYENEHHDNPDIYLLKTDPERISNLQVGQTFDFYVPELNQDYQAEINHTRNNSSGVHIFKGKILQGSKSDNVSIVRGKNLTFVTLATLDGVYTVTIDNITGEASMQSETSLNKGLHGNDMVMVEIPNIEQPE